MTARLTPERETAIRQFYDGIHRDCRNLPKPVRIESIIGDLLSELDAVRAELPRWRRVDIEPPPDARVLAWRSDVGVTLTDGYTLRLPVAGNRPKNTHWMPLPAAPKEEP